MTRNRLTAWTLLVLIALPGGLLRGQGDMEFKDGWVKAPEAKKGTPTGELMIIRNALADDEPGDALDAAEEFLENYPQSALREEAMLLGGEAQMERGRYVDAYEWFERQVNEFPRGRYLDRALKREYQIADAFLDGRKKRMWGIFRVDATDDGLEILTRIVESSPGTAIARKALLRMGDYHFEQKEYAEAVAMYDQFLRLYGKSGQADYAMLRAARASHLQYRGPKYDDSPLESARQRYTVFAERFPKRAKKLNVSRTLQDITDQLAGKLWNTAAFYERVDRPKAAIYYYKLILEKYPTSQWSSNASQALKQAAPAGPRREERTGKPTKLEELVPDKDTDEPKENR
jgi:outer membrane protein assembly factor BamD